MDDTKNQKLYKGALQAIRELFGDTSVSQEEAIQNLQSLIDEINIMIESLEEQ